MRLFDMLTRADMKRIKDQQDLSKRVRELENSLSIALDLNDELQRLNVKIKKEAEEDLTKALAGDPRVAESDKIIMKKMEEIEELKAELARAREEHQYDNMVHEKELESLRNPTTNLRNKGLL